MSVGFAVEEASYCSSKKRPAFEAVGVVTDLVVVSVSKTNAASESFVDNGVAEKERIEERRWERMVVFPEPDSPLKTPRHQEFSFYDFGPSKMFDLQENYCLVLCSPSQSCPSPPSQVLCLSHCTPRFSAIRTLR